MKLSDMMFIGWLAVFNAVTFLAFGCDKWLARGARSRIPESVLVLLAALGGWPGGAFAMNVFRHKTAKGMFKLKYALALVPFGAMVWAWLRWR